MKRIQTLAMAGCGLLATGILTGAEVKSVSGGVGYEALGTYDADRLNSILTKELEAFSSFPISYPPPRNEVRLFRIYYSTVIPEDNNRPVPASGLLAIPVNPPARPPLLSYQHGTVFSKDEVPSIPDKSMETRLMLACFAAHGYVVIAADYIGKGISTEPDSYLVKESTAQACLDMLIASRAVLADMNIQTGDLFLSGWSQGSFSTTVFQNRLEAIGEPVKAAGVASAPNDLYLCFNRWIHVRSEFDVQWLLGAAALLVHSYEKYYNLPGLADTAIRPAYRKTARDLYENKITWEEAAKSLPETTKELLTEEFVQSGTLVADRFSRALQNNQAYNWRFKTPTRFYYGQIDEVVTPYMVTLPVEYQKTIAGAPAEGIFAGEKANHRGTFLFSLKDLKAWFDRLSCQ